MFNILSLFFDLSQGDCVKHIILFTTLLLSCSIYASEKLRLIAEFNLPTGEKFKETEIGGLSGITFDQKNMKLISISDDRSRVNDARFYEFDFTLDEKNFSVKPSKIITLKDKDGHPFKKMTIDFEGITFLGDDLLISSEGGINHIPSINPDVFHFSREGAFKGLLEIPEKFNGSSKVEMKSGVRDNLAFETISTTMDGKFIFVGTEDALFQDGQTSSPTYAPITRLILYKQDLKPVKEVGYKLDLASAIAVGGLIVGENGLVDIAAVNENNFYSLERAYLPLAKKNIIKIFTNHIDDKTTDISKFDSILKMNITTVQKQLLSNLDDYSLKLDNLEGICFGPLLANGHQTLITVSDNNFSKKQRTEFLAFEIIP